MSPLKQPTTPDRTPPIFIKYIKLLLPVLMASIISIFQYWASNLGQVRPGVVVKPILIILFISFCLFNLFLLVLRNLSKTTLLTLLFILLFFSYGHIINLLESSTQVSKIINAKSLLIIYAFVLMFGMFCIFRITKIPQTLFFFLQLVIGLMLVFNLVQIILFDPRISTKKEVSSLSVSNTIQNGEPPDIYYIVLDAYARDDVLQNLYGFDNSAFLDGLRSRGFYIPACAFSNYDRTYDTVPSVLNLNYLDQFGIPNSALYDLNSSQIELILNSQVLSTFSSLGYETVTTRGYGSFIDIMDSDEYLNYYYSQGQKDELGERFFVQLFIETSLMRARTALSSLRPTAVSNGESAGQVITVDTSSLGYEESDFWYHQTNYVFDSLTKIPEQSGNYFVYAHINSPHGPYVFNQDGSFRFEPDLTNESLYYTDTLVYLNKRVLGLIDTILKESDVQPIIILQSDHGTHYYETGLEKHKILSAYYLPGEIALQPYDTITPVNNFRLVLHNYFDPSIELLPDTLLVMEDNVYQAVKADCDLQP